MLYQDYMDINFPQTTIPLSNNNLQLELQFLDGIEVYDKTLVWNAERRAPVVRATERWLKIICGALGIAGHELRIRISALDTQALALGRPVDFTLTKEHIFPTLGDVIIDKLFYCPARQAKFAEEHKIGTKSVADYFKRVLPSTILHELGHVFGIGSLWNLHRSGQDYYFPGEDEYSPALWRHWAARNASGWSYIKPHSQALKYYNEMVDDQAESIPLHNGYHLFNSLDLALDQRSSTTSIHHTLPTPPLLDEELMGNGTLISKITVGFLDDLGWDVDYDAADNLILDPSIEIRRTGFDLFP